MVALARERESREREIDRLERQVAALSSQVGAARSAPASGGSPSPRVTVLPSPLAAVAAPASVRQDPTAPSARPPITGASLREAYQGFFDGDQGDPSWTAPDEQRTELRLKEALPAGSALRSFDCRATMCRTETSHQDMPHYQAFVRAAFIDQETKVWNAGSSSSIISVAQDGSLVSVTFLGREGRDLPAVE